MTIRLRDQVWTGLACFCKDVHNNARLFCDFGSSPESWAWFVFQLRAAPDKVEWFPEGKWATIQRIEGYLLEEAYGLLGEVPNAR